MPKLFRIRLSPAEQRQLESTRRQSKDARPWKRATAILMSARGEPASVIAASLGVSLDTISDYRRRWLRRRALSLIDRPRAGRPPIADAAYLTELRRTLRASPRRLGFAFNVWRCERLAVYLERRTGKRICADRLSVILRNMNYRFRMPKHTLKGKRNEAEHDKALRRLQRLKKGLRSRVPISPSGSLTRAISICSLTWPESGSYAARTPECRHPERTDASRSSEP
jgi:transposase